MIKLKQKSVAEFSQACVLVVEDELFVRWAVSDALREAGYQVIEAINGEEAVTILRSGVRLDLVFTDVRMPGPVDGLALMEIVKQANPDTPVLITSGHSDPGVAIQRGAAHFLRKPYEIDALLGLVASELGGAGE